jgi:hypothetical protein
MLAFALDFMNEPLRGGLKHIVAYLPFVLLVFTGLLLRLVTLILRMESAWRAYRTG